MQTVAQIVLCLTCASGFTSDGIFKRLDYSDSVRLTQLNLPSQADLQELLTKKSDLSCPDEYTETGEKLTFTAGSIYIAKPAEDAEANHYGKYYLDGELPGSLDTVDVYNHAYVYIGTSVLEHDDFRDSILEEVSENIALSIRCVYRDQNYKKVVTKKTVNRSVSRCFELAKYSENDDAIDNSSNYFWCR